MNILNQPINPGGHPAFPAAKESGHLTPASIRFDGVPAQPSTAAAGRSSAHCPRWQAQTLRRASSYVGAEHEGATAGPAPALFKPPTLDFLRSLLDNNCSLSSALAGGEAGAGAAAVRAAGGRDLRRGAGRAPDRAHRAQDAPAHRLREPHGGERRGHVPDRRLRHLLRRR